MCWQSFWARAASISFIFILNASAASLSADEPARREKEPQIAGTVVDERGAPVADAEVWVEWHKGRSAAVSDSAGRFKLGVPGERIAGRLVRASADSGRRQAQFQFPWEAGAAAGDIKLELRPARRVELRVVDKEGRPVSGAKVGILGDYHDLAAGKTDDEGHVIFNVAHDARVAYVYALQPGQGFDYRAYVLLVEQRGDTNAKQPELPDGPITLRLDGTRALRVRVVESNDAPIAGITLYPWLLKKPDEPEEINLSYITETVQATTLSDGVAVFDWMPHWNERSVTVWPNSDDHVHQRGNYDPKTGDGTLVIKLDRLVPIGGRVTFADGSPAAGITIAASAPAISLTTFAASCRRMRTAATRSKQRRTWFTSSSSGTPSGPASREPVLPCGRTSRLRISTSCFVRRRESLAASRSARSKSP
jgi:hypothetical protein